MAKRDFNLAAKIFLGLSVVDIVLNIVKAYTKYQVTFTGGETLIIEMSINLMILIAIVFTFLKKRWALISLIALYIIRMFAVVSYGTDISVSYQLGGNFVYLIRDFAWFAIAMCFKKNGISGWKSMLSNSIHTEEQSTHLEQTELPPPIPIKKTTESKQHFSFKSTYIIWGLVVLVSITLGSLITSLVINKSANQVEEHLVPEKYLVIFDNGFQIWDNELYLNNFQMLREKRPEISIYKLQLTTNIDIDEYFYVTHIVDEGIWNGEKLLSKIAELKDTYPSCTVYQLVHIQGLYEDEIRFTAEGKNYHIPLDLVKDFTSDFPDAKLIKKEN